MVERNPWLTGAGTLLNADRAIMDRRELNAYSLNPVHESGGDKAVTFDEALGCNLTNVDALIAAIREETQVTPATPRGVDAHGAHFAVDLAIVGPTGRSAPVRTGWIYRPGATAPFLTTAFVRRRRSDARTPSS